LRNTTLDYFILKNENKEVGSNSKAATVGKDNKMKNKGPSSLSRTRAKQLFIEESEVFNAGSKKEILFEIKNYSSIKYTIRGKGNKILFWIGDIFLLSDQYTFRAICRKMWHHYKGEKEDERDNHLYLDFVHDPLIQKKWQKLRLERGRGKQILPPKGRHHDLEKILSKVRNIQFQGMKELPDIAWSKRAARKRYAHYDSLYNIIVISRILDSLKVPSYVLEFIIFHELLHVKMGIGKVKSKRRIHTPLFRKLERGHPFYKKTKSFLSKFK